MTEQEFIYSILNTARKAELNNDEPVSERLLRNYVRIHRPESLRKYYKDGHIVDDEVFQKIQIELVRVNGNLFQYKMPKLVRFAKNSGFYIEKYGSIISIGTSQEFQLNKTNEFNSKFIQAKSEGNELLLRVPTSVEGLDDTKENYLLIKGFLDSIAEQELDNFNNNENKPIKISLDFYAVLYNPSDAPGYDWENDIFPFPAERLPELEQQILIKEFGIMNQSKKDEVQNARADEVRYHDNEDVQSS